MSENDTRSKSSIVDNIIEKEARDLNSQSTTKWEHQRKNKRFHYLRWVAISLAALNILFAYLQKMSMSTVMIRMVNQTTLYLNKFPDGDLGDIYNGEEVGKGCSLVYL